MKTRTRGLVAAALLALAGFAAANTSLQVSVLDKEGKPVTNAVVVVVSAGRSTTPAGLPKDVVISQQNMRFVPAVSVVAVGAKAHFVNNDPWEHHVRASAAGIAQFNDDAAGGFELRIDGKAEGKAAKSADATFDKPGAVLLGCHLHNSMRGYVYVSDSPWASLTNAEGVATLNVPEGAAIIKVWHADQLIDIAPQQATLTAAPATATMQLSVVPRGRRL
ncbi:plastocyanin/azurin family copper-binding protein [Variovorax robiniae]|uniref:Plastocyanin/azurin family copper-binding protein n=1 Tax=Variovorax robiniae TaxID=1836199 RepID=A0ABU8X4R4_9BURK